MADEKHPRSELQDLIDGRLGAGVSAAVERHVATCETCSAELDLLREARSSVAALETDDDVQALLESRIRSALDDEDRGASAVLEPLPLAPPPRSPVRTWLALAAGIAAVVAGSLWLARSDPAMPDRIARDFEGYQEGRLALDFFSSDAAAIETFLAERGLAYRVIDLGMMSWTLAGGRDHELGGTRATFVPYTDPGGRVLLCQMYVGLLDDLPVADEVRENEGITFRIYRRGGITVAFWLEGDVVCVLASDIDSEELIELAFAKAMKA
jgi:hypothetical protein